MGKAKGGGPSLNRIFRGYFLENPELLDLNNNNQVYEMFERDHPDRTLDHKAKGVCANAKSTLRKARDAGTLDKVREDFHNKPARPGRTPRKAKAAAAPSAANGPAEAKGDLIKVLQQVESSAEKLFDQLRDTGKPDATTDLILKALRRARNMASLKLEEAGA